MTSVAVVILNYNGEKLLRQFLPSVVQYSEPAEVFVIDNGSTDSSRTILQNEFPSVKLVLLDNNYGFCGGYNRGLKLIDAKYFVLLNSDVEVTPGWIKPMLELANAQPNAAAIQPKILAHSSRNHFEYAGAGGGFIDLLGYPFCRGRLFDLVETDHGQYNDSRQVFWASGACMMIRADVYYKFGGLDEDFFAHMEEIDLCWKINRTDDRVYYCGQSTVYHLGAGTLGYESPKKTYLNFRNGLALLFKHFKTVELFYKLPVRVTMDWLACLQFLLKGKASNALAVLKAHAHFIRDFRGNFSKRRALQRHYRGYNTSTIYQRSIVLERFLRGKRFIDVSSPR